MSHEDQTAAATTMLYRAPGPHEIHGGHFDYVIVNDDQVEEHLAKGWHLTTPEAKAAHEAEQEAARIAAEEAARPPSREELVTKATELGIQFDGRTSDRKLGQLIAEKLGKA